MKSVLLGWLVLGLSTISSATSIDYFSKGSTGAGTATLTGSTRAGGIVGLTVPLMSINSLSATGTVIAQTGTLTATNTANVFDFGSGTVAIQSGGNTLFRSTFSSGTLTILGPAYFSISGKLSDGAVFTLTDKHGDVEGDTVVTPEPDTVRLLATGLGLVGVAAFIRRWRRRRLLREMNPSSNLAERTERVIA